MLWKHPIPVMEVGDQQRNCWAVKLWFSMLSVRFTVCALASLFVCSPLNISVWNNNVLWFESNQQMLIFFQYLRSVGWSCLYMWPNTPITTVRDSRCKIRSEWGYLPNIWWNYVRVHACPHDLAEAEVLYLICSKTLHLFWGKPRAMEADKIILCIPWQRNTLPFHILLLSLTVVCVL